MMHRLALERRAAIIRFFSSKGGTVEGMKVDELAAAMDIPYEQMKPHLRRLEDFGVLEVRRTGARGQGRLPNIYALKHDEKWFRAHADELEKHHRKLARDATIAARRAEEARVDARRAAREEAQAKAKKGAARRRKGLPSQEPPPGVPETKPIELSPALKRKLIAEGLALPAADLAVWGA